MHLIDTNYLVRLATGEPQSEEVSDFLLRCQQQEESVWMAWTSVLEFAWVMTKVYGRDLESVLDFLEKIYLSGLVTFENESVAALALHLSRGNNLGIENNYLLALAKLQGWQLHTFDGNLGRRFEEWK